MYTIKREKSITFSALFNSKLTDFQHSGGGGIMHDERSREGIILRNVESPLVYTDWAFVGRLADQ